MNKYKQLYLSSQVQIEKLIGQIKAGPFNPYPVDPFDRKAYATMLTAKDMMLCANRFMWENLPFELTSQQLESLFYRFGALAWFKRGEKWFATKFATVGELNPWGHLDCIEPIDFGGKSYGFKLNVISAGGKNPTPGNDNTAVIMMDYTTDYMAIDQMPRAIINGASTIKDEIEVYRQLFNNILVSIKKAIFLCQNEDQKNMVLQEAAELLGSDLPVGIMVGTSKKNIADALPEMFNFDNNFDTQNYCQQIEFYDKTRRNFNGIPTPDTFEKKERKITAEAENTQTHTDLIIIDGYYNRKYALDLLKKYYPDDAEIQKVQVKINPALMPQTAQEDDGDDVHEEGEENADKV